VVNFERNETAFRLTTRHFLLLHIVSRHRGGPTYGDSNVGYHERPDHRENLALHDQGRRQGSDGNGKSALPAGPRRTEERLEWRLDEPDLPAGPFPLRLAEQTRNVIGRKYAGQCGVVLRPILVGAFFHAAR